MCSTMVLQRRKGEKGIEAKWLNAKERLRAVQNLLWLGCISPSSQVRPMLISRFLPLAVLALLPVAASAGAVAIPLEAAATGTFYVKAGLNAAVETDLLLDTGSGYVSLSNRTFARLTAGTDPEPVRMITGILADGESVSVPIYRLAELRLAADCVLRDVEVAVFRNSARDILGLNALKRMQPFTLQLDPPLLSATCG